MWATGGKKRGRMVLAVAGVGLASIVSFAGVGTAGAQVVPGACPEVDGTDFFVGEGENATFDTDAYLAALAAQAECENGTGTLPVTGTSSADYTVAGVGLIVIGTAAVITTRRRRSDRPE